MNTYMLPNRGSPNSFWAHEWKTHGTCVSTMNPECYPDSPPHREVLDFFTITTGLFRTLDTYATLAAAGIVPSDTQTYSLDQLLAPLAAQHGAPVILKCTKHGVLNQVFYAFSVRGALQSGLFVPTDPVGDETECPDDGIQYPPKSSAGDEGL
jgi:ribonuclease T2